MEKQKIKFDFKFLDEKKNPFTWGTKKLDEIISPIEKHHFIVFGGESGAGKTAYTFDIAIKNAKLGHKVAYLSLEMNGEDIIKRIGRSASCMSKSQVRTNTFSEEQKLVFIKKCNEINNLENFIPFGFDSGESQTIEDIFEKTMKIKPDLLFIDNFDKIQPSDENLNTLQSQEYISKEIMNFTNKVKIPIILIHHFKKGQKKGEMKGLDDLRGSAKISHDADMVIVGSREQGENLSNFDKSKFKLSQIKDRDFGEGGFGIVYFDRGTFKDESRFKAEDLEGALQI